MSLLELGGLVDVPTLGALLAFWVRWEAWRAQHDARHREIDRVLMVGGGGHV